MSEKKAKSIERVVEVATALFSRSTFADVSVNHIAALARCSTATIYEVFGSKEDLYRIAAETSIANCTFPRLQRQLGAPALWPLFDYLWQRLAFLTDPDLAR